MAEEIDLSFTDEDVTTLREAGDYFQSRGSHAFQEKLARIQKKVEDHIRTQREFDDLLDMDGTDGNTFLSGAEDGPEADQN